VTSDPHIRLLASPMQEIDSPSAAGPRLRLKPKGSLAGYVDGGWWPRSRDLAVELPALARVLAVRLGGVSRIAFALTAWYPPPRQITVDGRTIRMEGFRTQDEYIVHVSGPNRQRTTLLVIPQNAATNAAHEAMTTASKRDNIDPPGTILADAGIAAGLPPRPRLIHDDERG
jgi:hypothetical protein